MTRFHQRALAMSVAIAAFAITSLCFTREAAAIPVFYQTGEDIFEAGPLPPALEKDAKLQGAKAGYKCEVFGLFWAYMAWWKCQPVAFSGDTYNDEPPVQAAVSQAYPQSAMHMSLWAGYGRWVIGLVLIGGAAARFLKKKNDG